jgi:hypothetical protein
LKKVWYRCPDGSFKKIKTNENEYVMRKFLASIFKKTDSTLENVESQLSVVDEINKETEHDLRSVKEPLSILSEEIIEAEESPSSHKRVPKKRKKKSAQEITNSAVDQNSFQSISQQKMKLISVAGEIRLNPDKAESAFIARQLVQATLPHKNPGNIPAWSRKNGDLTLTLRPGWDEKTGKNIGYPYGTLPRLLLFWITTEAVRTKNPRIELGNSLSKFMEELGLDPYQGGKRSDVKRLQEQMRRLFQSTISFTQSTRGYSWINMQVAPKGMLWWDEKKPTQTTLFENWIHLGEDFFKAITSSPVPVDMRILRALKRSPLALDFYSWATYTAYQTQQTGQSRSISWKLLHEQFGSEYKDTKEFTRKACLALLKVKSMYPEFDFERIYGGIKVLPSRSSITIKQKKKKQVLI